MKSCCPEPHHNPVHDPKAHRLHHWKERAVCLGGCVLLHLFLEFAL